ncbi:MAG: hypothetical protein FJ028_06570 [Chloroflexi bacterium]|nr:hypothetical protein [Chloroflexota bacterium]
MAPLDAARGRHRRAGVQDREREGDLGERVETVRRLDRRAADGGPLPQGPSDRARLVDERRERDREERAERDERDRCTMREARPPGHEEQERTARQCYGRRNEGKLGWHAACSSVLRKVDIRLLPRQQLKVTPKRIAANHILQLSSQELQEVIDKELEAS